MKSPICTLILILWWNLANGQPCTNCWDSRMCKDDPRNEAGLRLCQKMELDKYRLKSARSDLLKNDVSLKISAPHKINNPHKPPRETLFLCTSNFSSGGVIRINLNYI